MGNPFKERLKHAWNAFISNENSEFVTPAGPSYTYRPDRSVIRPTNERSIIMSAMNQISMDVAAVSIRHVRLDEEDRYADTIPSGLNYAITVEANIDQTSTALIQDIVLSLFDEGVVAVVPVDTTINPNVSGSFDIVTLRTGRILEWYPQKVRVSVYNERTGKKEDLLLDKKFVAIIENPLYAIMNQPNGTLRRLIRKLNILDAIDEQSGSGKLDLIIQLPYVIKTAARREQAETRRADIEMQLSGSKYGIAYTDGTEKITQLNRPAENNLMEQIKYLTSMLYSQLGIAEGVFNGTADEKVMLNYQNRTIIPLVRAITDEFKRKFLTKTARSQRQSIMSFRDVFAFVPAEKLADIADKFTRNEIISSNEMRGVIGMRPSKQPGADELRNKNINAASSPEPSKDGGTSDSSQGGGPPVGDFGEDSTA